MRLKNLAVISILLLVSIDARAQLGLRGQLYLPNGAPLHRIIRFTFSTDDGNRQEILFTDSNGRIEVVQAVNVPFTITIPSDDETYDTTTASFDPAYAGKYVLIHLKPLAAKSGNPPGLVSANATDQSISPRAKEAYDSALGLIQAQQYEQAVEPLKRALALEPNYFRAYNDLGVVYMKLNRLDLAADALRHAIKINDRMYLPRLNLGKVLNQQGKYRESAEVLTRLQSNNAADLARRVNAPLVEALIGAKQWALAEEEIKKGLMLQSADAVDLKIKLGMVMIRQGKSAAAVAILNEASEAEPDNALAHFNLGTALFQSGSLDKAETALSRAYALKQSEMPGAQLLLGDLYFQRKEYPKAIEAFKAYLRDLPSAPNAAQVKEAIERLRRAVDKQ
ncbi:MAG: tetratricopeptide repeat protein [Acidobacteriota bacterium]